MASISADVAIVGGGLMGCYSAYFLRRRGRSVVVIDKGSACAAASGVNFGNLRLQGAHPQEFPLSLGRRRSGRDLPASPERIAASFPAGTCIWDLRQAISPSWNAAAHDARAAGLDVELLDGPAARRRWPVLSQAVTGASWSKRDAVADPAIASPRVARLAQRAGARLLEHTKVIAVERTGTGFALRTEQGSTVTCGHVVNAAGAWAGTLRGNSASLCRCSRPDRRCSRSSRRHAYAGPSLHAVDGTLLLRPGRNGEAVAGSFPRVKADIATGTAIVPRDRVERGLARLAEVVPGLGRIARGRIWSGVEGYLPDMLPVIGWSRTTPGLLHAFGFSGHGFQLAPGVGAVVADLIVDWLVGDPDRKLLD